MAITEIRKDAFDFQREILIGKLNLFICHRRGEFKNWKNRSRKNRQVL